jgi:hypothetical protein
MVRDEAMLIWMRNRMLEDLESAIEWYKKFGGKEHISDTLTRIANTQGYNVDVACEEGFYRFGRLYSQKHIKIVEADEGFTIRLFKMENDNLVMDYDSEMLMSKAEREQIAFDEIEAERRMSLYNSGYRDF